MRLASLQNHAASFSSEFTFAQCDPQGDMLLNQDLDGHEVYSVCYFPSLKEGRLGPSSGHSQCDEGSYFMVEAPRFCCRNARIELGGQRIKAKGEVCGDVLGEFHPEMQQFRVTRGPAATGSSTQLRQAAKDGFASSLPSPVGMQALSAGSEWQPVGGAMCKGRMGTLVRWTHSDPAGKAEMCNAGSPPVRGQGYSSWACDDSYIKESRKYCCTVKGHTHCVGTFTDMRPGPTCNCPEIGGPSDTIEAKSASVIPPWLAGAILGASGDQQQLHRQLPLPQRWGRRRARPRCGSRGFL